MSRSVPSLEEDRSKLPVCPKCMGYGNFYSICDCGDGKERPSEADETEMALAFHELESERLGRAALTRLKKEEQKLGFSAVR